MIKRKHHLISSMRKLLFESSEIALGDADDGAGGDGLFGGDDVLEAVAGVDHDEGGAVSHSQNTAP